MSKESNRRRESRKLKTGNYVKHKVELANILKGLPESYVPVEIVTYRERPIGLEPLFVKWVCSEGDWSMSPSIASHAAHVAFSEHVLQKHNIIANEYQYLGRAWKVKVLSSAIPDGARVLR